jgi:hypothetical protein
MCPACIAGAATVVAGVVFTGGATALAAKWIAIKRRATTILSQQQKRKEK